MTKLSSGSGCVWGSPHRVFTLSAYLYLFPFFPALRSIHTSKKNHHQTLAAKLPFRMYKFRRQPTQKHCTFVHRIQHAQKENARINSVPPAPSLCDWYHLWIDSVFLAPPRRKESQMHSKKSWKKTCLRRLIQHPHWKLTRALANEFSEKRKPWDV